MRRERLQSCSLDGKQHDVVVKAGLAVQVIPSSILAPVFPGPFLCGAPVPTNGAGM
jgi:hypothetical protein